MPDARLTRSEVVEMFQREPASGDETPGIAYDFTSDPRRQDVAMLEDVSPGLSFSACTLRAEGLLERLEAQAARLTGLANRLCGPAPRPASTAKAHLSGILPEHQAQLDRMSNSLADLERAVQRIAIAIG